MNCLNGDCARILVQHSPTSSSLDDDDNMAVVEASAEATTGHLYIVCAFHVNLISISSGFECRRL